MRSGSLNAVRRGTLSLGALATAAMLASSAHAAFPGTPGPLVYPRVKLNPSGDTGGLFLHGPRQKQKPRRLISSPSAEAPSFSANGKLVAFSASAAVPGAAVGRHIYVVKADGTGLRQLTTGSTFDAHPSFSPDSRRIVFDRDPGQGKSHIFSIAIDGTGLRQLTKGVFNDSEPVFTPSGKRIVFVSDRDHDVRTDRSDIFAMGPAGEKPRVLIDGPRNEEEPDTSPDGKRIVFVSNRAPGINIFVARANGKRVSQLTHNKRDCFSGNCNLSPVWSPDGRHIAYLAVGRYSSDLEVMRADGGGTVKEFSDGGTEEEGFGTKVGAPGWGVARP